MPRHFTPADRDYALERLITNRGDVARTAAEFGITARTLYRWRKESQIDSLTLTTLTPIATDPTQLSPIPTDDAQALRALKARMLGLADLLANSVEPAIQAAPLGQRIAGLTQLIDRIIKLAAQLPEEEVQYVLSDDVEEEHDFEGTSVAYSSYGSEGGFEE